MAYPPRRAAAHMLVTALRLPWLTVSTRKPSRYLARVWPVHRDATICRDLHVCHRPPRNRSRVLPAVTEPDVLNGPSSRAGPGP